MTMLYPIVLETEENGAVSAYVPGLPVYAAADSHAKAERAIRAVLTEYLNEHPGTRPEAQIRVARVSRRGKARISVVGPAALLGAKSSEAKARASRANGRLGGRPSRTATTRTNRRKASR
jgi:predicted RNase H-like HicB family nuclease